MIPPNKPPLLVALLAMVLIAYVTARKDIRPWARRGLLILGFVAFGVALWYRKQRLG